MALRYSINVTLDGCCDHRAIPADEELHRLAAEMLAGADALILGRVTYGMMEDAWRPVARGETTDWVEPWMIPFARTIDAAPKYVVLATLDRWTGTPSWSVATRCMPSGSSSGSRAGASTSAA